MEQKDTTNQLKEEFRKEMAKYYYQIGKDEIYEDICTESDERLIRDAYKFGKSYFRICNYVQYQDAN